MSLKSNTPRFLFFKAGVWIMQFNFCFSLKHWLWLYDCVCVCARACCIPLCGIVRQAICPFYKMSCIHGDSCLQQIPFLGSFFLRPDKLNLTVIWVISPFRCRYCLPGSTVRQPYLCLQLAETKSFSLPVISSLRPCTQRRSESQTSNVRL